VRKIELRQGTGTCASASCSGEEKSPRCTTQPISCSTATQWLLRCTMRCEGGTVPNSSKAKRVLATACESSSSRLANSPSILLSMSSTRCMTMTVLQSQAQTCRQPLALCTGTSHDCRSAIRRETAMASFITCRARFVASSLLICSTRDKGTQMMCL
jgi:hypothetical protein